MRMPPLRSADGRVTFTREVRPNQVILTGIVDVPPDGALRHVQIAVTKRARAWEATINIDGPVCLRHRFSAKPVTRPFDPRPLCLMWSGDRQDRRWTITTRAGLAALVGRIRVHAFQEHECRAGRPWPGDEAPGDHPRKKDCPSCRGEGA